MGPHRFRWFLNVLSKRILGVEFYEVALLKSILFLCEGGIHLNLGNQDIQYGNILNSCSVKSLALLISLTRLCGFPCLAGFYYKDLIIAYFSNLKYDFIVCLIFYISIIFTRRYSIRLLIWLFITKYKFVNYIYLNEEKVGIWDRVDIWDIKVLTINTYNCKLQVFNYSWFRIRNIWRKHIYFMCEHFHSSLLWLNSINMKRNRKKEFCICEFEDRSKLKGNKILQMFQVSTIAIISRFHHFWSIVLCFQ